MKTKLNQFLVYDKVDQNIKKQEPLLLLEHRQWYVYALLDPRKIGARIYRDLKYVFTLEPFYIGFGHNLRFYDHFKEADDLWKKSNKEINTKYNPIKIFKIHQIYRDYDLPRVVIIKEGLTLKEAKEYEIFCIKQIGRKDKEEGPLTNLTDGGDGWSGYIRGKKYSENIKKALIGKKHTEERKQKNSISHLQNKCYNNKNPMSGRKHTEIARKRMSENHADFSGENNPMFGKHPILTQEHKDKISKYQRGRPKSDEWKRKMREAWIRRKQAKQFK